MAAAYDISASLASSSAANPIAQFGDVSVVGGGGRQWITWAIIIGGILLAVVLWKKLK